jgi:HTH-type transcriptional regulator/antitoxin HigA
MTHSALVNAWQTFMLTANPHLNIGDEQSYYSALETLEQLLESCDDNEDDPLNPLIDMLASAIEKYESQDDELMAFVNEAQGLPADIALLKTLMRQHQLTGSDLPEIGGKTMVSKVLKGERILNRSAIEQLSVRFGLSPAFFFDH